MVGIEGGRINIVPVDFVADALDHIAHKKGLDGKMLPPDRSRAAPHRRGAQHLRERRARAADDDAPQRADVRLHPGADPVRPRLARAGQARDPRRADRPRHPAATCSSSSTGRRATTTARPRRRSRARASRCRRSRRTRRSCGTTGSATSTRTSSSTASLAGRVKDKVVVVTGGSSGIGKATAIKLAGAGAKVILVARGEEKLARDEGRRSSARAARRWIYTATSPTSRRATRSSRAC